MKDGAYPAGWRARGPVQQTQQHLCGRVCRRAAHGSDAIIRSGRVWRGQDNRDQGRKHPDCAQRRGAVACTVTESEFLGAETLIGLDHAGTRALRAEAGPFDDAEGSESTSPFTTKDLHVFDAQGQRLARMKSPAANNQTKTKGEET